MTTKIGVTAQALGAQLRWSSAPQVSLGERATIAIALWMQFLGFWQLEHFGSQSIQYGQSERKVERTAVDAIYQNPLGYMHPVRLQLQSQVGIGHVSAVAQFFNQRLGPSLVKLPGFHSYLSCIEIDARILKSIRVLERNASKLMHSYKAASFTSCHYRQVLKTRS